MASPRSAMDRPTLEALLASDPVGLERWVVAAVGGTPADWLEDQGIDGVVSTASDDTGNPDRLLVAVKAGNGFDARMVRDLARTVQTQDADGGVLVLADAPGPAVYEAAERAGLRDRSGDDIPCVQILTIAEVLNGKRPALGAA